MEKIKTWNDLKQFCNALNEHQLQQAVAIDENEVAGIWLNAMSEEEYKLILSQITYE